MEMLSIFEASLRQDRGSQAVSLGPRVGPRSGPTVDPAIGKIPGTAPRRIETPQPRHAAAAALAAGDGFARIVLARHGARPLLFQGRLLASVSNQSRSMPVLSEAAIHEAEQGFLVASARHRMVEIGGPDLCFAEACDGPGEVRAFFGSHIPRAELPLPAFGWGDADSWTRWHAAFAQFDEAWAALLLALLGPERQDF